MTLVVGAINRQ